MNSFQRLLSVQSRRCLHSSSRRLARQETNVMNVFDRKVNEDTLCLKNFNALKFYWRTNFQQSIWNLKVCKFHLEENGLFKMRHYSETKRFVDYQKTAQYAEWILIEIVNYIYKTYTMKKRASEVQNYTQPK